VIGERLERAMQTLGLDYIVSKQGVKVFPEGMREISATDHWNADSKLPTRSDHSRTILELLKQIQGFGLTLSKLNTFIL